MLKDAKYVLALFIVSIVAFFSLPIFGNFSLNDDFLYYDAVADFQTKFEYNYLNYTSILLTQIIIGSIFTTFFGLSIVTLRILTILFAIASVIVCFYFFKENKFSLKESFLISLLFLFNPLFFNMSVTFLSDIYFTFFVLLGFYYFKKYQNTEKKIFFFVSALMTLASVFVRQWSIGILCLILLYSFINKKFSLKDKCVLSFLFLLAVFGFIFSLAQISFFDQSSPFKVGFGFPTLAKFFGIPFYIFGFFIFPLGLTLFFDKVAFKKMFENKNKLAASFLLIISVILIGLIFYSKTIPYFPNLIHLDGIGLKFLTGGANDAIPTEFWWIVTVLSAIAFFGTINSVNLKKVFVEHKWVLILSCGLFFAYVAASFFTDRYILPLLAPAYFMVFSQIKNYKVFFTGLLITMVFFGAFSYLFTFEYLSWNTKKNDLVNELFENGVKKVEIDGGYEYCQATYSSDQKMLVKNSKDVYRGICYNGCKEDGFVITFKPLEGCRIVKEEPYNVLGFAFGKLYVLSRP